MTGKYKAVSWNRQKRIYDLAIGAFILAGIGVYVAMTLALKPNATAETLILRSTAIAAFVLLHIVLCIGPLARLDRRFLPILYNRRHLGVATFLFAFMHAAVALFTFHTVGETNPLVNVFTAYATDYTPFGPTGRPSHFPFEPFGLLALVILFIMAATSHDFWLRNLGASFWKALHIFVYIAYGALLVHVAYGVLQSERSALYPVFLTGGFVTVFGLHLVAQAKEAKLDRQTGTAKPDGYIEACAVAELSEGCGKTVVIGRERRALYRHQGRVYALSNVCRHQGGPIGEGRILDGCVTCPWHGWQYRPESGTSPPPFHEVIETYPVRIEHGTIYVHSEPNPLEQTSNGAAIPGESER